MGNSKTKTYQINNSSMSSKKGHSFFSGLSCNIIRSRKKKCDNRYKSKSLNFDENIEIKNYTHSHCTDENKVVDINSANNNDGQSNLLKYENHDSINNIIKKSPESFDKISSNCSPSEIYEHESKNTILRSYPRLSESSLNSDDLMLSTDVNLDQVDDDVSKDYNTSEKDDPFIAGNCRGSSNHNSIINKHPKSMHSNSIDVSVDESERHDIVSFDSSRESSTSIQRKTIAKGYSLRPHSFSSPLRPSNRDPKVLAKRNSNLSTVDSVDLAWTWISASETANLSQDVSNLKLMLLKMRRLLLDEVSNDAFMSSSRFDASSNQVSGSNVFSEPTTPICYNVMPNSFPIDTDISRSRQWETMSKDMLIQELQDLQQQNGDLQYQLKEKTRIIELLQDQQQNYKNFPRRFHSISSKSDSFNRRIKRSSTFETASSLIQTFSQDSNSSLTNSLDTKVSQQEGKLIETQ